MTLQHAFKEWAVICAALAQARQAIILRKGGIDEEFKVEQKRFWLYPTYTHQQHEGIKPEAASLLAEVEAQRPPAGMIRLSHWAEVTGIYHVRAVALALMLGHLHLWADEAVAKRFAYRQPGLNVLSVRVHRAGEIHEVQELPAYHGCRSWVALQTPLNIEGSTPVMSDADYHELQYSLDLLLSPTAMA